MKIETLESRITKAEEKITKKRNTIEKKTNLRFKKMEKMNKLDPRSDEARWMQFDIENLIEDVDRLSKEVAETEEKLAGYKEQLQEELKKANSRNIEVILKFLEGWKNNVKAYYESVLPEWIERRNAYYEADHKACEWFNSHFHGDRRNPELEKARKEAKEMFQMLNFLNPYIEGHRENIHLNMERLQKDLDHEANMKYDFMVERTKHIVGEITDASYLSINPKGDIDGIIIGTEGKASINTIGAGGYNIQCYHFRTLINEIK